MGTRSVFKQDAFARKEIINLQDITKLIITFFIFVIGINDAQSFSFKVNDIKYDVISETERTVSVCDYSYASGDIIIPQEIWYSGNGEIYTVKYIDYYSSGTFYNNSKITSVELPESLIYIGEMTFSGCSNLIEVSGGSNLKFIGKKAFENCKNLKGGIQLSNVEEIKENAFYNCKALEGKISLDNILTLNSHAFEMCDKISEVSFGNNLSIIDEYAFSNCSNLLNVTFGDSLTIIGAYAFFKCRSIKNLKFPDSLDYIGTCAFRSCLDLKTIIFNDSITEIGGFAFENCKELEGKLILPNSLLRVCNDAFSNCEKISYLQIGKNVNYIEKGAFLGCINLKDIECYAFNPPECYESIWDWDQIFSNFDIPLHVQIGRKIPYKSSQVWRKFNNIVEDLTPEFPVTNIKLNYSEIELEENTLIQLSAIIEPENANLKKLEWVSSDTKIADVNENGLVKTNSQGKAKITVHALDGSNISAQCEIIVIPKVVVATDISLSESNLIIKIGQTETLSANVTPSNTTEKIIWYSDNSLIASVDEDGLITGISEGSAVITATCGEVSATCEVAVISAEPEPEKSINLDKEEVTVNVGEYIELRAVVYPEDSSQAFDWKSKESGIISIQGDNLIRGKAKIYGVAEGVDYITATCGDLSASCKVTVVDNYPVIEAESIEINYGAVDLSIGDYLQLTATVSPIETTDKTVMWSSSDENIVSVDETGLITGISEGSAVITATCGEVSATCEVSVKSNQPEPDRYILLDKEDITVKVGEYIELKATIYPDSEQFGFNWMSRESGITSIQGGNLIGGEAMIYGIKDGEDVITVSIDDISATCKVTVIPSEPVYPESIQLRYGMISMEVDQEVQNFAYVSPDNTTVSVVWSSSDSEIVSVDQTGLMTALKEGYAIITATCGEVSATCEITVATKGPEEPLPSIIWDQEFRCNLNDRIRLEAFSPENFEIGYKCIRTGGNYKEILIEQEENEWYASCIEEGTIKIEACIKDYPEINISKVFNIIADGENLLYENGLYYRYYNEESLQVVQGYELYSGDLNIPAVALGMPVYAIGEDILNNCFDLNKVFIENGVIEIKSGAFGNSSLDEIHIPISIKNLGAWCFNVCSNLKDIYIYSYHPLKADESTFNGYVDYSTCNLHIPQGSLVLYKEADIWKNFLNIYEDLPKNIQAEMIVLNIEETELTIGETLQLEATVLPEDTTNKTVTWSSSNKNIAIVSEAGLVTAISKGIATITATNGNISATCQITVLTPIIEAEQIILNLESSELKIGETVQLEATVLPEDTTDKSLTWDSSDPNVATVSENGLVAAISAGTAIITATCGEASAECLITVLEDAGVESLLANPDSKITIYTIDGILIKKDCKVEDLKTLDKGIYIIVSGKEHYKISI